jgi:hypothetical protein
VTESDATPAFRRFPWIQLVFCIACLSMTGWTWMRYSYAWELTSADLRVEDVDAEAHRLVGRYVRVRPGKLDEVDGRGRVEMLRLPPSSSGGDVESFLFVLPTASRFHPASIAGLLVGAMGCFIFGLYLRSWLRERKALACGLPQDMTV